MDEKGLTFPLHYAEHGVHQCWSCANYISNHEVYLNVGVFSRVLFLLPECRVADQYMLYTTSVPCEKYKSCITGD